MMGQWALYQNGWILSTKVNRAPWEAFGPANPDPLNNQVFQLYNLNTDFAQADDIAAANPQKVQELKAQFIAEAKKYQVFPLDASLSLLSWRSPRLVPLVFRPKMALRA